MKYYVSCLDLTSWDHFNLYHAVFTMTILNSLFFLKLVVALKPANNLQLKM